MKELPLQVAKLVLHECMKGGKITIDSLDIRMTFYLALQAYLCKNLSMF